MGEQDVLEVDVDTFAAVSVAGGTDRWVEEGRPVLTGLR